MSIFSKNLKSARLDKKMTQQQVADLLGITKSTYCGYETNKREPDVAKIKLLSKVLGVSGDILLGLPHADTIEKPPATDESETGDNRLNEIIDVYNSMNEEGRAFLHTTSQMCSANPAYKKRDFSNESA